jgi:hypothetical protein
MVAACIRTYGNATRNVKRNMDPRINEARSEIAAIQSISIHHKETTAYDEIKIYSSGCFC